MIMFIIIASTVLVLLGVYFWWRGFAPVLPRGGLRSTAALLLALGLASYPFLWFIRRMGLESSPTDLLSWFGNLTFGFVSIGVVLLLTRDAGLLATLPFRRRRPRVQRPEKVDHGRRAAIRTSLDVSLLAATGGLSATGLYLARKTPEIRRVNVPVAGLHPDLDGLRVAQLSDIHIGPTVKRDWVERIAERTDELQADIIAVTGDLVDGAVDHLIHDAAPLGELQAPLGKYYVTGNHEYYSGVFPWLAEMERLGYQPLVNGHRMIRHGGARLAVAGVTDYRAGRIVPEQATDPKKALEGTADADFRLMLAHQPRSVYGCVRHGADLILSGHTHGGQYWPYTEAIHWFQPYIAGLYSHESSQIYVSRGTGYWGPPMRLGSASEITELTLRQT